MLLNWLAFFGLGIVAYICISWFAQSTGGQNTNIVQAGLAALKPLPLVILIVGNVFFAMAVFMGFKNTTFAIPATIAVGILTAALYSVFALGASLTLMKALGVAAVLLGIFLMR